MLVERNNILFRIGLRRLLIKLNRKCAFLNAKQAISHLQREETENYPFLGNGK